MALTMSQAFQDALCALVAAELKEMDSKSHSGDTTLTDSTTVDSCLQSCLYFLADDGLDVNMTVTSCHPYENLPLIHYCLLLTARCECLLLAKEQSLEEARSSEIDLSELSCASKLRKVLESLVLRNDVDLLKTHSQTGAMTVLHFVIVHCLTLYSSVRRQQPEGVLQYPLSLFTHLCQLLHRKEATVTGFGFQQDTETDATQIEEEETASKSKGKKVDMRRVVDCKDGSGFTALWRAFETCQFLVARMLLTQFAHSVDVNQTNGPLQQTVAHLVFGHWPTTDPSGYQIIDDHKCKLGIADANGNIPLILAQQKYREESGVSEEEAKAAAAEADVGCGFEIFMAMGPDLEAMCSGRKKPKALTRATLELQSMHQMTLVAKKQLATLCPVYSKWHPTADELVTETETHATDSGTVEEYADEKLMCPFEDLHKYLIASKMKEAKEAMAATLKSKDTVTSIDGVVEEEMAASTGDSAAAVGDDWKANIPAKYRMFADQLTPEQIQRVIEGKCPFVFEEATDKTSAAASDVHTTMDAGSGGKGMKGSIGEVAEYTMEEVAVHNSVSDAWIVLEKRVYDVSEFLSRHPGGGGVIVKVLGKDCTRAFDAVCHSFDAREERDEYLIGALVDVKKAPSGCPVASGSEEEGTGCLLM